MHLVGIDQVNAKKTDITVWIPKMQEEKVGQVQVVGLAVAR